MSDPNELVYAVPRRRLFGPVEPWLGVRPAGGEDVEGILERARTEGFHVPRREAESDPGIKQIIPYLVLRDGERIFLMRRTRAGGDARLHDLYTIGIGGHLNPRDDTFQAGLEREWREELVAGFVPEFRFVGLLNDDTVEVGIHHLGVVYEADAAGRRVEIRETDKLSGSFESLEGLRSVYGSMETWSQLALDALTSDASPVVATANLPASQIE